MDESEWQTRKQRIDTRLRACNPPWHLTLSPTFSGNLGPQDPNDEPAEKLLERIRDQRKRADPVLSRGKAQQQARHAQP